MNTNQQSEQMEENVLKIKVDYKRFIVKWANKIKLSTRGLDETVSLVWKSGKQRFIALFWLWKTLVMVL